MKIFPTLYATLISIFKSFPRKTEKVETVSDVDLARYMGRWYEISSYPQWFEKGLTNVSAYYTLKEGFDSSKLVEMRIY